LPQVLLHFVTPGQMAFSGPVARVCLVCSAS
jgi:hypothetical protein